MANMDLTTNNTWSVEVTPNVSSDKTVLLSTNQKYLDRDIEVVVKGMSDGSAGAVSLGALTGAADVGIDISEDSTSTRTNIGLANVDIGDALDTTNYPYYFGVKASGTSKTISSGAVTGSTAGYIPAGTTLIAAGNKTATVTAKEKQEYVKLKKATLGAAVTGSVTVTPSATTDMTTISKPSTGTVGADYYSITPGASQTGSFGASASVSAEGYVKTDVSGTSSSSKTPTISTSVTTLYVDKAKGSVTGNNLSGTNDVNLNTNDGTGTNQGGTNISSIVGTKASDEPNDGYYLAFDASSSATAQTQTAKITTAGYTPTNNSFATRSVSYSASTATKYFPITKAEGTASISGISLKASAAKHADTNIAGVGAATTTKPSTGTYYVAVTPSPAVNGTAPTAKFSVTQAGYMPTGDINASGTISATTASGGTPTTYFTVPNASFKNAATSGVTYTDISSNDHIIPSGGYLYINAGYTGNAKISLAKLVPDAATLVASTSADIISGAKAYDSNGALITGSMTDNISLSKGLTSVTVSATYPTGHQYYQIAPSGTGRIQSATVANIDVYQGVYSITE